MSDLRVKFNAMAEKGKKIVVVVSLDRLTITKVEDGNIEAWESQSSGDGFWTISPATFDALAAIDPGHHLVWNINGETGIAAALSVPTGLIDLTHVDDKPGEKAL
jgi:hypothetical protein